VQVHPDSAAAHNNYATVLLAQGKTQQAMLAAERALALARDDMNLQTQIKETLNEIRTVSAKSGS